jgi:hypothetical protein
LDEFCSCGKVLADCCAFYHFSLYGFPHRESQGIQIEELVGCLQWHRVHRDVTDIEAAADKMVEVLLTGNSCPNRFALIVGKSSTLFGANIAVEILDRSSRLGRNCR